jgi:site-specific DNA recombinase
VIATASPKAVSRNGGAASPPVPIGIYTRVSTDERLDMEFNSIDAQRAACESFIATRRADGWYAVSERYDDAGISGGTLDRPALHRLLSDVDAGKIAGIVFYKLDRLSRSLLDFAKLVDLLERKGIFIASASQDLNSATSMGRFMINTLLSFAQYEREVIAERTHDKMQATRRRGMWTGGFPILGFDIVDRKLRVNEAEAERVRRVFETFLTNGGLVTTLEEMERLGIRRKAWTNQRGKHVGGQRFDKASLRHLLSNRIYLGQIRAGDEWVQGQHAAIVDPQTFEQVQAKLRDRPARRPRRRVPSDLLLSGLVVCAKCGCGMSPHYASRSGRRYGSYVCATYAKSGAKACPGSRIAAHDLEQHVVERIAHVGRDERVIAETVAAARKAATTRRPGLEAAIGEAEAQHRRLADERKNYLDAIGSQGCRSPKLLERLGETEAALHGVDTRLAALRSELAALDGSVVNAETVRKALADFMPLWEVLFPAERRRIAQLLMEEIRVDRQAGEVEIRFRTSGIRMLAEERARGEGGQA